MILCVSLSPAVQRTLCFDSLSIGSVNRATDTAITTGGKALNVARVLRLLDAQSHLVQALGGDTGRFVDRDLTEAGISHETVWSENDSPTRTCTTLLTSNGSVTELVEEAAPLSPQDLDSLTTLILQRLPQAEALCLSGSFPTGVPDDFYREFVEAARARGIPALVDAQRVPLRHALAGRPFMVKPNLEEAARTMGFDLSGDVQADASVAIRALTEAGAAWAVVSVGSAGAFLGNQAGELWVVKPPGVQVVNSIGSGDSLAAGILCALVKDQSSVPEAVVFGTACATANCLTGTVGFIEPRRVRELMPGVKLTKLG